MIRELQRKNFDKVRSLFNDLCAFQAMCVAVLNGDFPGKVFVDDTDSPTTACLLSLLEKMDQAGKN